MAEELERIYTIPLKKAGFKSSKAAPTAVKRIKEYLSKHMKVEKDKIWMDDSLNNMIWSMGRYKMPSKIRVKAVKFDDGVVETFIPEIDFKKSRRELIKEEREKKEPILKREEAEEGEEEATGADDYEIAPSADGDVKIKKKKPSKQKDKKDEGTKKTSKSKETKKDTKKEPKEKAKKEKTEKKSSKTKTSKKKTTSKRQEKSSSTKKSKTTKKKSTKEKKEK